MLSRLKSKKDTTRRPFDDIGNIEHDGAEEDEDMVRWNRRKNKSKSKVNTDGDAKIQDKENAPPSQPSNKVDQFTDKKSRVLVAETKTTDAESKSMSCSPDKSISSPMPQVPPVNTTNTSSDQAKADFMTFEGLLQSGRCRLTPIKSSEKSQRSSPASCDFLSPSSIPRNDSVITTSDSSTLSNEQKFGTPPSVLTSKASTQRHSHSDHSRTVQPVSQDKSIQDNKKEDTPPSPTDIARIMEAERLFSKVRHNRMEIVERALKEGCDPHMTVSPPPSLAWPCHIIIAPSCYVLIISIGLFYAGSEWKYAHAYLCAK